MNPIPEKIKVGQRYKNTNKNGEIKEDSPIYKINQIYIQTPRKIMIVLEIYAGDVIKRNTVDYEEFYKKVFENQELKII
ncbi:MAG: hypothetical protein ACOCP8_07630 [archaeon]